MSEIEDLIEGLLHVGVMAVTYQAGHSAQKSFAEASERNDPWAMLFSAIACGASMYGFQWSARKLGRLIGSQRALPVYDLQENWSRETPIWYLPK